MAEKKLAVPTVHIGGTSGEKLFDDLCVALGGIRAAMNAVHATAPHGRDYDMANGSALCDAVAEHRARIEKLTSVRSELEVLAEHVADSMIRRQPVSGVGFEAKRRLRGLRRDF